MDFFCVSSQHDSKFPYPKMECGELLLYPVAMQSLGYDIQAWLSCSECLYYGDLIEIKCQGKCSWNTQPTIGFQTVSTGANKITKAVNIERMMFIVHVHKYSLA